MPVTISEQTVRTVKRVTFDWISSTGGDATAATTKNYDGQVMHLVTVPSTSAAPTAAYTITVTDGNSVDVLSGAASTGRSATATEYNRQTTLGWVADSVLTITVAAAGDTKAGKTHLWIR